MASLHLASEKETRRLRVLHALELLDTTPDAELDRLTTIVADALSVPVCSVALMDTDRLWFKSGRGLGVTHCARDASFCDHVIRAEAGMVCHDLREDERFRAHPLVCAETDALRFYAGVPIRIDGAVLGTLCVLDFQPRHDFDAMRLARLESYAEVVEHALMARQQRLTTQRERALFSAGPVAALIWEVQSDAASIAYISDNMARLIGAERYVRLEAGERFEQLIWKPDAKAFRESIKAHTLGTQGRMETTFRLDNGRTWLNQISYGDRDEHGKLVTIRAYLSDVSRQKLLEASIETTRERLYLAMESAQIGTWDVSLRTHERIVNARTATMLGYRPDEIDLSQQNWVDLIHPFDRNHVNKALEEHVRSCQDNPQQDAVFSKQYRIRHKHGHYIWVQSHGKAVTMPDDKGPSRIVGTLIDITEAKNAELHRQRTQMLLDLLHTIQRDFLLDKSLDSACEALFQPLLKLTDSQFGFIGIVEHAPDGSLLLRVPSISNISWDEASERWYHEQKNSENGLVFSKLDNLFGRTVTHNEVICTNDPGTHPASRGTPRGHPVLESFLGLPITFDGQVVGMIGLGNRDEGFDQALVHLLTPLLSTLGTLIHARKIEDQRAQAEAQLFTQATQDSLTGLANRRRFFDIAEQALQQASRYGNSLSIAMLDLDHFKRINDTHGHAAGDAVLRHVAQILSASLRTTDLGARVGGEEFAILMPSTGIPDACIPLERIRSHTEACEIDVDGKLIRVTCSIGLSTWRPGLSLDQVIGEADTQLYRAKDEGRNRLCTSATPAPWQPAQQPPQEAIPPTSAATPS